MAITRRRLLAARTLAVVADGIQLGLLPIFIEGWLSPVNDALDIAVALAMTLLVGWHWAFAPAFISELVPVLGLVPTWTAAVLLATRGVMPVSVLPPSPGKPAEVEPRPRPDRRLP
jgi:hypothetical protein